METETFDVIILGAGSTGENVAQRVVQGGLTAVVVEHELVGGECSYWACMPSKALLRPIEAVDAARRVKGTSIPADALDVEAVLARRDSFTSHWNDDGQVRWLERTGITLRRGSARLTGERRVAVTDNGEQTQLIANHAVVICTGSTATVVPIAGIEDVDPWTSREATSAKVIPDRLAIIGGGVVGCEMAAAFHGLGTAVTMLVRDDRLLTGVEPFAGRAVAEALSAKGIDLRFTTEVAQAAPDGGNVRLELNDGSTISVDEVLLATGRQPNTDDIGIDTVDLDPGKPLHTDDSGLVEGVAGDWLYAAGDVTTWAKLTHMGKYHARICGDTIVARAHGDSVSGDPWSAHRATALHDAVPQVVFTDPQVAAVGLTEQAAIAAGFPVKVVEYALPHVAGAAVFDDHAVGSAQMVVDTSREVIVGVTLVGSAVGELLHAATIAIVAEVPLARLWHAVPAYPTVSEIWLRLLEAYGM